MRDRLVKVIQEYNQNLLDYRNLIDIRYGPQVADRNPTFTAQVKQEPTNEERDKNNYLNQLKKKSEEGFITIIDIDTSTVVERPREPVSETVRPHSMLYPGAGEDFDL